MRGRTALLGLTVAVLLAACSGSGSGAQGSPGTLPAGSDAPKEAPGTAATDGVPDTSGDVAGSPLRFGTGAFQLADPAVGMAELPAFQATVQITFEGTGADAAEQWTQTETSVTNRDPRLAQFDSARTGARAHTLQHVDVGGVEYDRDDTGACTARVAEPASVEEPDDFAPRRQPVELLPALIGGDEVGAESIEGVDTIHYTFDERGLGLTSPVTAVGDVWVAVTGGHVVRYSLVVDGATPYVGQSGEGHLTIEYELQVLAAPPVVTAPADCPAGLVEALPPADAIGVVDRPGIQTFTTAGAVADVQAWYDGELPAAGWVAVTEPLVAGETTMLTYQRAAERLVVSISHDGAATSVIVLLTR